MGGAERVILAQAELLQKVGHTVTCQFAYVNTERLFKTSVKRFNEYFNISVFKSEILRLGLSVLLAPLISNGLRDADLLICHCYGPSSWIGYNAKRIRGTRYISYVHSLPRFLYLPPEMKKDWNCEATRKFVSGVSMFGRPVLEGIDRVGIKNSEMILANSLFTARRIMEVYGLKSTVCYPPVNTEMFKPLNDEFIHEVYTRFALSRPLVFSAGRIVPIKKYEWLIKAMKYVVGNIPSTTLAISGDIDQSNTSYVHKLIKLAESLNIRKNVRFLGFVPDGTLVKLYNAADVFAYQVPAEDFGLGPVEAMACGTPAVVWDDKAGPCETVLNKEAGLRAEAYNIKDFAEKLQESISLEWSKPKLINFAKDNFSSERHMTVLTKAINSLHQ